LHCTKYPVKLMLKADSCDSRTNKKIMTMFTLLRDASTVSLSYIM